MKETHYIDRDTKQLCVEKVYGRWAFSLLYGYSFGARLFSFIFLPLLARMPIFSRFYGYLQRREKSKKKIAAFIDAFHIDTKEFVKSVGSFRSFNDFFIREIKSEARPISSQAAIMPVDGRYLVIPDVSESSGFYVKGQRFCIDSFLCSSQLSQRYRKGSIVIARLSPMDYHRFHFPISGTPGPARLIPGALFSVHPLALARRFFIFWENKRVVTEIDTANFGKVTMVEIGATCVGSIHQTYLPDRPVNKGEEKGYFSFGGSCVVLLFEPKSISFDKDLIDHSLRCLETKCRFGTSLGL